MKAQASRTAWLLAGAVVIVIVLGCGETAEIGELVKESRSVEQGDAESVEVDIEMGMGNLHISGGAKNLMEGKFVYNVVGWEPEIEYEVFNGRGELTVRRPVGQASRLGRRARYEWDIRLDDDVPMNLDIQIGAGEAHLDLGSLSLDRLDVSAGAGEVGVYLTGQPSVGKLTMETGAGDVTVDLTGDWRDDLTAVIAGGVGRLTVRLPADVGVRVDADKGIGKITARGFVRDGDTFVNDAYGESDVTLDISCKTGIGAIILELEGRSEREGATI